MSSAALLGTGNEPINQLAKECSDQSAMVALPTWLNLNPPSFDLNNMLFTSPAPVWLLQALSIIKGAISVKHPGAHNSLVPFMPARRQSPSP